MSPLKHSNNFAARMGRWSASHWKTAVFGWLAFVVAVRDRQRRRRQVLDDERHERRRGPQADKIIEAGFPKAREQGEMVLIQSDTYTAPTRVPAP